MLPELARGGWMAGEAFPESKSSADVSSGSISGVHFGDGICSFIHSSNKPSKGTGIVLKGFNLKASLKQKSGWVFSRHRECFKESLR